jgi:arginase
MNTNIQENHSHCLGHFANPGQSHLVLKDSRIVSVIGAPFNGGQPRGGVEQGPQVMRDAGLLKSIEDVGWKAIDAGDIPVPAVSDNDFFGNTKKPRYVGSVTRSLYNTVKQAAKDNHFPLTVGGDHSLAIGSIAGVLAARPETCIIWVDAHADINIHETSGSGNIHGMPVAFLMALKGMRETPGFEWMLETENNSFVIPHLKPERIAYIGLRDLDDGEKGLIRQLGIKAFSMYSVDKCGIGEVMKRALDAVNPNRDRPIHLSFDVDGIDSTIVPATGTPVPGGINYREARFICETLAETNLLSSMDLMEINPTLSDEKGKKLTLDTSMMLVRSALGATLV